MSGQGRRPLKVGLFLGLFERFMDGRTGRWTDIAAMAHRAEEIGFDSIWLPDHLLMQQGDEPVGMWECISILSALAAVTTRIELGTLVVCGGFRNPAMLAKMADTIEEISGGRLILGLGAGYHDAEYRAFGYPTDHRYSRFAEAIHIIHALLRHGSIDFRGTYYQARECVLQPRGPRPGGPPIMIGARGQKMLGLVSQYADVWSVVSRGRSGADGLRPVMSMLDAACKEIGRNPSTLERSALVIWNASERIDVMPGWFSSGFGPPWVGAPDEIAEVFREFAQAGISQLQVVVCPHTLAGLERFRPVLEALDRTR